MNLNRKLSLTQQNAQLYKRNRQIPMVSTKFNSFWVTLNMIFSLLLNEVHQYRDTQVGLMKYQIICLLHIPLRNKMPTLSLRALCVSTGTKRSRTWRDKSIRWVAASITTRVSCSSSPKGKIPIMVIPVIMRHKGRKWSLFCQKYELG